MYGYILNQRTSRLCATGFRLAFRSRCMLLATTRSLVLKQWRYITNRFLSQGLRLHDNPALLEACKDAAHVYPIFILDPFFLKSGQYK
jgi:hypothetical protein